MRRSPQVLEQHRQTIVVAARVVAGGKPDRQVRRNLGVDEALAREQPHRRVHRPLRLAGAGRLGDDRRRPARRARLIGQRQPSELSGGAGDLERLGLDPRDRAVQGACCAQHLRQPFGCDTAQVQLLG